MHLYRNKLIGCPKLAEYSKQINTGSSKNKTYRMQSKIIFGILTAEYSKKCLFLVGSKRTLIPLSTLMGNYVILYLQTDFTTSCCKYIAHGSMTVSKGRENRSGKSILRFFF